MMTTVWLYMLACFCITEQSIPRLDFTYHNYTALTEYLHDVATAYPNVTKLYSIGTSVKGMMLWVLELTTAPATKLGVPSVKLIGNIHGNEPAGREVLLHLIEFFVINYDSDDAVRWLLDNTRIHILPCLNPDGFRISVEGKCELGPGRENARHIDLNRSFPDHFEKNMVPQQVETEAVKNWLHNNTFVLSASLHGGALVANYPYENVKESTWDAAFQLVNSSNFSKTNPWRQLYPAVAKMRGDTFPPSLSPDDDVFRHLAMTYSFTHPSMHRGEPCNSRNQGFENGITNGAVWYTLTGGMQDYNYVFHGCMEITLEISCCKYPVASELPQLWTNNKKPLLMYIGEVHTGVKGLVLDSVTSLPVKNTSLKISGREIPFHTSSQGEFWRILLPGDYELEVSAPSYIPKKIAFSVPKMENALYLTPVWLNVTISTSEHQDTTVSGSTECCSTSTVWETRELTTVSTKSLEVYDRHKDSNYEQMAITTSDSDRIVCTNIALLIMCVYVITVASSLTGVNLFV